MFLLTHCAPSSPHRSVFVLLTFLDSRLLVRSQGSQPWWGRTLAVSESGGGCVWPACPPSPTEITSDLCNHTQRPQAEPVHQAPPLSPPNTGSPRLKRVGQEGRQASVSSPAFEGLGHSGVPLVEKLNTGVTDYPSFPGCPGHFKALSLGFLLCKMGIITAQPCTGTSEIWTFPTSPSRFTSCPISKPSERMLGRAGLRGLGRWPSFPTPSSRA